MSQKVFSKPHLKNEIITLVGSIAEIVNAASAIVKYMKWKKVLATEKSAICEAYFAS